MSDNPVYAFRQGDTPLLVSMPHVGTQVPRIILDNFTESATHLPDTDWYVDRLYDFVMELGIGFIRANYSRYVIDLNRPISGESLYPGQRVTEIVPTFQFDGSPIYRPGLEPSAEEVDRRIQLYWAPYHAKLKEELDRLHDKFGYAILWDAHSIKSCVPGLFEGDLPDLNFGTGSGKSCASQLIERIVSSVSAKNNTIALDGRFKGGHITRNYGNPSVKVHAIQLEISQATYMKNESTFEYDEEKALILKMELMRVLETALRWRN